MVKNKLMALILILTAILAACGSESSSGDLL